MHGSDLLISLMYNPDLNQLPLSKVTHNSEKRQKSLGKIHNFELREHFLLIVISDYLLVKGRCPRSREQDNSSVYELAGLTPSVLPVSSQLS